MSGLSRTVTAVACSWLLLVAAPSARSLSIPPPASAMNQPADEQALRPFLKALSDYVAIREHLHQEVPKLTPNSEAREISAASDALARAIQRARAKARQGDFFDKGASQVLIRRLREAIKAHHLEADLASIDDEPPRVAAPRVHLRFPDAAQMASMPPSLLRVLPPLPQGLEYRIVGQSLVLRDTGAALILDFIPQAIPVK